MMNGREKDCDTCLQAEKSVDDLPCRACRRHHGANTHWVPRKEPCAGNGLRDLADEFPITRDAARTETAVSCGPEVDSKIAHGSKKSAPFLRALTEVWRVSMFGAQKHGANNWQSARPDGMHYYEDALWRHWIERRLGEVRAEDSGCYHLAHMAWNALMLLEMELRGVTNPDWGSGDGR